MKSYPMLVLAVVVIAALLLLDTLRPSFLLHQTEYDAIDSLRPYALVLTGEPRETPTSYRYEAEVIGVGKVLAYIAKDAGPLNIGDTVLAKTRIRRGGTIGDFDYGLYLRRQGFLGTAYVRKYDVRRKRTAAEEALSALGGKWAKWG